MERLPNGYRFRFAYASDVFARLGPIIDAERRCCRFLHFAISAAEDKERCRLRLLARLARWASSRAGSAQTRD